MCELRLYNYHFYKANLHVNMITCLHVYMFTCLQIHQVLRLLNYTRLYPRLFYVHNNFGVTFLTVFILTHPVNLPCGGNRGTRRNPMTFGRALTDSFHKRL
jgi:hypothetical protein